jgi:hypothetical protein
MNALIASLRAGSRLPVVGAARLIDVPYMVATWPEALTMTRPILEFELIHSNNNPNEDAIA